MTWSTPTDPLIGRTLGGKYVVETKLGSGGFGAVYRAKQIPVGRPVAVKVAHPDAPDRPLVRERFLREANALARMRCRAVAMFFDFGEAEDGLMYMVQEFVDGVTLADVLQNGGRIVSLRAIDVACAVLEALAEAHSLGIVHRDIKPANIMITRSARSDEQVKLLDFGLAKSWLDGWQDGRMNTLTQENRIPGTPGYMAPEMWNQEALTGATDLYAVGVLLYRAVSGCLPFDNMSLPRLMQAHVGTEPPDPPANVDVPAGLIAVIKRAMAKVPSDRYATAAEMDAALRNALPDETMRLSPIDMNLVHSLSGELEASAENEYTNPSTNELSVSDVSVVIDEPTIKNPIGAGLPPIGVVPVAAISPVASNTLLPSGPLPRAPQAAEPRSATPLPRAPQARAPQPRAPQPRAPQFVASRGATPTVHRAVVPGRRAPWGLILLGLVVGLIVVALVWVALQPGTPAQLVVDPQPIPIAADVGIEVIKARPNAPITAAPWTGPNPDAAPPSKAVPPTDAAPPTAGSQTPASKSRRVNRRNRRASTRAPSPAQQAARLAKSIRRDIAKCRCKAVPARLKALQSIDAGLHGTLRSQYQQACQLLGVGCLEDP